MILSSYKVHFILFLACLKAFTDFVPGFTSSTASSLNLLDYLIISTRERLARAQLNPVLLISGLSFNKSKSNSIFRIDFGTPIKFRSVSLKTGMKNS